MAGLSVRDGCEQEQCGLFLSIFRCERASEEDKSSARNMSDDEDISEDIKSLRDFCGLRTRDNCIRGQFLDTLGRTLEAWRDNEENGYNKLIAEILPGILRLSERCPFSDVREKCSSILKNLKVKAGQPGVILCPCE